jgi:hypothetical protein
MWARYLVRSMYETTMHRFRSLSLDPGKIDKPDAHQRTTWTLDIQRLLRKNITPLQVEEMIKWIDGDDFWSMNCRTASALYRKWDTLLASRQRNAQYKKREDRSDRRVADTERILAGERLSGDEWRGRLR